MTSCDALIVGGGPAGSTCARFLRTAGWDVVILDRAVFPRDKVCAGWLTPEVFAALELNPEDYRAAGLILQDIRRFRTGVLGRPLIETTYHDVVSYAIRRYEFDAFLLHRSGATVTDGTALTSLRRDGDRWVANDAITARVVIGAGGHFCPVAKLVRGDARRDSVVVAREAEVRLEGSEDVRIPTAPQLFFCHDLDGYAWCVRKGDYVNVGIGRRDKEGFGRHVDQFARYLEDSGTFGRASRVRWRGHAYLASGIGAHPVVADGLMLIGDAAGLAYPESGEGIRPAIESGRLAADTLIAAGGRADCAALEPYASTLRATHPPTTRPASGPQPARTAIGRALLGSKSFTRHVLLNRWFLRSRPPGQP